MSMAKLSVGNRSSKSSNNSGSVRQSTSSNDIDILSDAGQRVKYSPPTQKSSRPSTPAAPAPPLPKKDRGKDRQSGSAEMSFAGPLAAAEFERLKKENELLKSSLSEQRKAVKKHAKKIEELKAEVISGKATRDEQEAQNQLLKSKHSRKEELLKTIETSLTCHICMDLLSKPFSLSPCGHTFCLRDLQDWFRKAPPTEEDMDLDTEDPEYIKFRPKHCPACRAAIKNRPLPAFLVRDIVDTLQKAKASGDVAGATLTHRSSSPYISEDPWEGIFPNDSELEEADAEDEGEVMGFGVLYDSDSEMDILEEESYYDSNGERMELEEEEEASVIGDEEEAEMESGEEDPADEEEEDDYSDDGDDIPYVVPQWEPPLYNTPEGSVNQPHLLRRGCPPWLSTTYRIRYSHNNGLILHLNSLDPEDVGVLPYGSTGRMHRLFVGWNIHNEDDVLSEAGARLFVTHTLEEYRHNRHRFSVHERPSGFMDVHVLVRADRVTEYGTTDSEIW
ncbi:hypothetical protein BT96DRAFT_934283 [Gymnopus androsaceus JB14]|uniref:RING-type domain-containing protein n=1 Tax=Gymnopus androsaceus JB14 TaxID=1447944 RepID=A0A6A4IC12_9AGAR|nr:hypothetical protein BT96DRAFT_934283 [Gymnopus androsaceus JB14]